MILEPPVIVMAGFTKTVYAVLPVTPSESVAVIVSTYEPTGVVESAEILPLPGLKVIPCKLVGLIESVNGDVPLLPEAPGDDCGMVTVV